MTKKKTEGGAISNSQIASDELRDFIERYESLESDKKAIATDQKDLMAEAKGRGWDTKIMRRVIAERKRDADEVAEEESILDLYRMALGMDGSGNSGGGGDDTDGMV